MNTYTYVAGVGIDDRILPTLYMYVIDISVNTRACVRMRVRDVCSNLSYSSCHGLACDFSNVY